MVAFPPADTAGCAWRGTVDAPITKRPAGAQSCYHMNVLIFKPTSGWTPADSEAAGAGGIVIGLCSDIIKSAIGDLERLK